MHDDDPVTCWAQEMHSPDARRREEAVRQIWLRFAERLRGMIHRRLDPRILRRTDADDVLQSLFASFFAAGPGPMGPPRNRDELWWRLLRFTQCKVANTAEHHFALQRDVRRERPQGDEQANEGETTPMWLLVRMDRAKPTPAEAVLFNEEFELRLAKLPKNLRQIALWKLEGYTNLEIAAKIGRVERTVENELSRIRRRWKTSFDTAGID